MISFHLFQFDPELVLVSAGFDAAWGDPLGKCKVSPEMYGHMTHHLQGLANGKVFIWRIYDVINVTE